MNDQPVLSRQAFTQKKRLDPCLLDPEDVADASASCADLYSVFDSVLDEFRQ